jgi:hypothetical protein
MANDRQKEGLARLMQDDCIVMRHKSKDVRKRRAANKVARKTRKRK